MPPTKKRKLNSKAPEEISFDDSARADYLTGFHKRKQARIKHAQDTAREKEKEEKRRDRAELRQRRKEELEEHVKTVERMIREANPDSKVQVPGDEDEEEAGKGEDGEWEGFGDNNVPAAAEGRQEDEYVDEDQYATVTVEAVDIDRDGFVLPPADVEDGVASDQEGGAGAAQDEAADTAAGGKLAGQGKKRVITKRGPDGEAAKKRKKKKFRYESKGDRKVNRAKERSKGRAQANARKGKK